MSAVDDSSSRVVERERQGAAAELRLIDRSDDLAETTRHTRRRRMGAIEAKALETAAANRTWLSLLLGLAGIVGVALATIVIEDWFDKEPFQWAPLAWFLVPLSVGGVLLRLRSKVEHERGTLYYVRLLHHAMSDFHELAVVRRSAAHEEVRVVARWIDPDAAAGPVHVLTDHTTDLSIELERCFNSDTARTGFHLAPNLLWPAALALGYDVPLPADADLLEFMTPLTGRQLQRGQGALTRRKRKAIGRRLRQLDAPLEWRPGAQAAVDKSFARPRVVTYMSGSAPREARRVLITAELTAEGPPDPPSWPVDVIQRIAVFTHSTAQAKLREQLRASQDRPDAIRRLPARWVEIDTDVRNARHRAWAAYLRRPIVRARPWDSPASRAGLSSMSFEDFQESLAVVHPVTAARVCFETIRDALHSHPNAQVFVNLRVPKTVAFALGQLLATADKPLRHDPVHPQKFCRQESCMNPWSRIVPLNFDSVSGHGYALVRVHDAQPSATKLIARLLDPNPGSATTRSSW